MAYANRLRVLRAERRKSQMDTAAEAGISLNRFWRIENGYTEPDESERKAIARVLAATVTEAFPESVAS